jgi:hypothetical protein
VIVTDTAIEISAEDAYLWRPDGNAPGSDRHPFRAVRLVNATGFTLQPGPVAIFARGTFVGDSLLDRLELDEPKPWVASHLPDRPGAQTTRAPPLHPAPPWPKSKASCRSRRRQS